MNWKGLSIISQARLSINPPYDHSSRKIDPYFMKKFIVPLQAFAALFLCSGMAWMIFVLASINPTPPTAIDLQARNTQDLSFANMNSTAVALAKQMLANMAPSPAGQIFLPITSVETVTSAPSALVTLKAVSIVVNTPTPTRYYLPPTATRKKRDTLVPAVNTSAPTETAVSIPTNTKPPTQTPPKRPTVTPSDTATIAPTVAPTQTVPPTPVPPTEVTPDPPTEPVATDPPALTEPPTQATP